MQSCSLLLLGQAGCSCRACCCRGLQCLCDHFNTVNVVCFQTSLPCWLACNAEGWTSLICAPLRADCPLRLRS